jgi:hypothetical protein
MESKAFIEGYNRDRIFRYFGKRGRLAGNILLCGSERKIFTEVFRAAERDTVPRYDSTGNGNGVA